MDEIYIRLTNNTVISVYPETIPMKKGSFDLKRTAVILILNNANNITIEFENVNQFYKFQEQINELSK